MFLIHGAGWLLVVHCTDETSGSLINVRRIIQVTLILGVTIGCLAYAVHGMDFAAVKASFARANYMSLPPMMLILVLFYAIKAWRWSLLLRPIKDLSSREVTPALMIGFMANNLLPAHLGEFVRVFVLGQQYELKKTPVLSTVVLERVFDILAILLLLGISLPYISGMPPDLERACQIFGAASLTGVVVLLVYMTCTTWFVRTAGAILGKARFLPTKLTNAVIEMLETGAVGLKAVRHPKLLVGIAISSIAQWVLNAGMIYAAMLAFGVEGTYFEAVLVMGVIVFAILLPSTPGYFGVIQACFTAVLVAPVWELLSEVARSELQANVFGASIYYHMCQYIPVTLTGLFFANRIGLSLGAMQSEAQGNACTSQAAT